ncbi:hypothetical protein Fmac_005609 [Flemingia macrophylla]|uniref:Uncharacterized protein n=1 Tax=Flemingia macrophylla TaxID=520843 RepID=A0ABD1N8D9_9FABA
MLLHLKSSFSDPASLISLWIVVGGPNSAHYAWSDVLYMETPAFSVGGGGARLGGNRNAFSNRRAARVIQRSITRVSLFRLGIAMARTLLLYSNLLEEGTPVELGTHKNLEVLDVSRNTISGFLPKELGSCLELAVLVLSNLFDPHGDVVGRLGGRNDEFNYFEKTILVEVLALPKLRILWSPMVNLEDNF